MKNVETYKLSVVLDVDGQKSLATIEVNDKALRKLDDVAQRAGKSLRASLADGLREVGTNLANIKAGLDLARDVGGFLFGLARGAADAGSRYHDLSVETDLYVETLSGLDLQLKQSHTDAEALSRATVTMQRNLGEAASGNKELQRSFAALGIKDVRAALRDTDGTFRTVIKSLGEMESAGERNAAGSKVMGKGFKDLSVFIEDTHGDLQTVIDDARRAGRVMSDEAAAAADEFGDKLDGVTNDIQVAARSFGLELVPVFTEGFDDLSGALAENQNRWHEWGRDVADVIRGVRALVQSEFGQQFWQSVGYIDQLEQQVNPLRQLLNRAAQAGERARMNDPTDAYRSIVRGDATVALELLKSTLGAPKPKRDADDFFSGGGTKSKGDSELESAKKRFVQTLKDWADTFQIPRSALRELNSQSKVHRGAGHRSGLAVDISPQFMTADAIEGARRAGLKVLPELYKGYGPNGYSTGPHYHVEAMSKAAQAENKTFDEQESILGSLARRLAEVELRNRNLTQSSVEQEIASARLSLGLQKLTGPAAELAEELLQDYQAQLEAEKAAKDHAEALDALKGLVSSTAAEVFGAASAQDTMAASLRKADVALSSYRGQWAMLLGTMKDVEPLMKGVGDFAVPGVEVPQLSGPALVTSPNAPEAPKPDKIKQVWKEITTLGDETHRLQFAFSQLAQALQSQQQVGQKRGFFSKLLGFASPFLSLIPGVGPILSLGARVASSALAGDYVGAALGAAGGLAPGGAFRPAGNSATPPINGSPFRNIPGGVPLNPTPIEKRAAGGPIRRGRAYILNELRPEPIVFGDDAHVYPSVGDYVGRGGGARQGGGIGAMVARLLEAAHRQAEAAEGLHAKIASMPADHVVTIGSRGRGAQAAIAGAYQSHAGRDPQALEWLRRRTQQQVAA